MNEEQVSEARRFEGTHVVMKIKDFQVQQLRVREREIYDPWKMERETNMGLGRKRGKEVNFVVNSGT